MKVKQVIAREGLILIALVLLAMTCFQLDSWMSKAFDRHGKRMLSPKEIEKHELFKPAHRNTQGFDSLTAIPVESKLSREDYKEFSKEELLNRAGFTNIHSHFMFFDELERRFGVTQGAKVDAYFSESKKVEKEMEDWGEDHLAAMAEISLEDFHGSLKRIEHLTRRGDFSQVGIFFFLFAYPLYLIVSFVVWSIKTLRQPNK